MIKGIIFDKDGTLFDFNATWGTWALRMLTAEVGHDPVQFAALADVLGFDVPTEQFLPGSIVIAETVDIVAARMLDVLHDTTMDALRARMNAAAIGVAQVEATPLLPFFDGLRGSGLRLGIATNDAEAPAVAHLEQAGILDHFDFIAGYDSGHGAKPGAGQILAFLTQTGLAADEAVMVGDSVHDLTAGRAAGVRTIGVLTGPAAAPELAPHADVVLPSIADIPDWLAGQTAAGTRPSS